MIPLVLDFESYYDPATGYTLTKMPTQQYIRDPQFRCLGVAVATSNGSRWVLPEQLDEFLAALPWERIELICHNARFDYALLRQHWPHLPKPARVFCTRDMGRYLVAQGVLDANQRVSLLEMGKLVGYAKGDTLMATRAGGAALEAYATGDAVATLALYDRYAHYVPAMERDLIDLHARMQAEPALELDEAKLRALAEETPDPLAEKFRSKAVFAEALRRFGIEPETKQGKRGEDYAFAKTDAFMQELADHPDERVQMLAALRTEGQSNIVRTRAQRLLSCGSPLGVPLAYYAAHTGRAGGTDGINLQNLPARNPQSLALRESLMAPAGHSLVVVDSAQIEVRVNAWLSGEQWLLDALAGGADPYIAYAARALDKPQGEVTKQERQWAKAPVLAFGFGQGANGYLTYCQRSGISMDAQTAERECDQYRALHRNIVAAWNRNQREATTGRVELPSGRTLTYPDLRREGGEIVFGRHSIFSRGSARQVVKLWHGQATENRVQAVARDIVMEQTLACVKAGLRCVMQVHDEAVFVVRDEDAEEARRMATQMFSTAPEWADGLPVAGEARISKRYGK